MSCEAWNWSYEYRNCGIGEEENKDPDITIKIKKQVKESFHLPSDIDHMFRTVSFPKEYTYIYIFSPNSFLVVLFWDPSGILVPSHSEILRMINPSMWKN